MKEKTKAYFIVLGVLLIAAVIGIGIQELRIRMILSNLGANDSMVATAQAGQAQAEAEMNRMREAQASELTVPSATAMSVPVPGPTQIVLIGSSEYSYTAAVSNEGSPSISRIRVVVVTADDTDVDNLAVRMQGSSELKPVLRGQPVVYDLDLAEGKNSYYTIELVRTLENGGTDLIGSSGQFELYGGNTGIVVFTYVPREPQPGN